MHSIQHLKFQSNNPIFTDIFLQATTHERAFGLLLIATFEIPINPNENGHLKTCGLFTFVRLSKICLWSHQW